MQLFYGYAENGVAHLTEDESKHAIKVLRKKAGDIIHVMDGKGSLFTGPIAEDHQKRCSIRIEEHLENWGAIPYSFHLAIAPTKNMDRLEWLLEKAVEIGLTEVTPLLCDHSERKVLKPERLEKILLSACKQSLKGTLPVLNALTKFTDFVERESELPRYIGYCGEGEKVFLPEAMKANGPSACVLIGPEGDFSPREFELASENGIIPITLGEQRMRTETAGLTAVQSAHISNELFFKRK